MVLDDFQGDNHSKSRQFFYNAKRDVKNNKDKNNSAANLNLDILEVQKDPKLGVQTGKYCQEDIRGTMGGAGVKTIGRLAELIQQTLKHSTVLQTFILT